MNAPKPVRFIGEPVEVELGAQHAGPLHQPPALEKKPACPTAFVWRGERHVVAEILSEWFDYTRRGRMARNMQPGHAATAARRGSWGVGRFYFQVRTQEGRAFELYYDRAPKRADQRKGAWFLVSELENRNVQAGGV